MDSPLTFRTPRVLAVFVLSAALALGIAVPAGVAGAASATYVVRKGDTLTGIAARHRIGVAAIARANKISNIHKLKAGTRLTIPGAVPGAVPAPVVTGAPPAEYVVQKGDSMGALAKRFRVSVAALAAANGITNVNSVRYGMKLTIPGVAAVTVEKSVAPAPAGPAGIPVSLRRSPERMALMPQFDKWAAANGLPADLVKAVGWQESNWRATARSSAGAIGIGQLMPNTSAYISGTLIGVALDPRNPEHNIRMTARYLRYLLKIQNGDVRLAVASYYQGHNSIARYGVRPDTQAYVNSVMAHRASFA